MATSRPGQARSPADLRSLRPSCPAQRVGFRAGTVPPPIRYVRGTALARALGALALGYALLRNRDV